MYKYINVLFSIDCAAQCFREFCCRSANFRNIPFKDGRENCELLHGVHALAEEEPGNLERCDNYDYLVVGQEEVNKVLKGVVTRGKFFLQLATQRRFKLPFTGEIASCNTSSLQNNPTAGHTTTCICLQFYRSLQYLFHPNFRFKLQEKIASCDSALSKCFSFSRNSMPFEKFNVHK